MNQKYNEVKEAIIKANPDLKNRQPCGWCTTSTAGFSDCSHDESEE